MTRTRMGRSLGTGLLALGLLPSPGWAQSRARSLQIRTEAKVDQPDARRTKEELSNLLAHYPPAVRTVLGTDPSLLGNQSYLAPYPGLAAFLREHPEIARNPSYYVPAAPPQTVYVQAPPPPSPPSARTWQATQQETMRAYQMWNDILSGIAVLIGLGMGIGLLVWLIRTLVDYRRWNHLAKVQTEVHTKLLDRFTSNDDLLAYLQSPTGSKFLESSPIRLDAAPRSMGAPMGRILWSVQGGIVLFAAGAGLQIAIWRSAEAWAQGLRVLAAIGIALGVGFVISAIISYVLSRRLGLIEPPQPPSNERGASTPREAGGQLRVS